MRNHNDSSNSNSILVIIMTIVITSNRNIKHKKNDCEMTDFTSPYKKWPRHGGLAEYSKMIQEIEGTLNTED